ncbi:MAG: flavin reductase family protein, partial [Mesorhizobium sp.]|nr:flavin reductase family protein [Mesorhizobium sp.]
MPRVTSAPGSVACEVADLVAGGDHVVALGRVLGARSVPGAPSPTTTSGASARTPRWTCRRPADPPWPWRR